MSWQHAGLFPADFEVHTFVQIFFVIQCIWTGVMGFLCTYNPVFSSCLSETGVFKRISWTQAPSLWSCRQKDAAPADSHCSTTNDVAEVHKNDVVIDIDKPCGDDVVPFDSHCATTDDVEAGHKNDVLPAGSHCATTGHDKEELFVHPNIRSAWSVRGGSMTYVAAGALYFGTRETYTVAMAAILWREAYDCIDLFLYKKDAYKILFRFWWSPIGPMPPLASFNLCNVLAMVAVLIAD